MPSCDIIINDFDVNPILNLRSIVEENNLDNHLFSTLLAKEGSI